MSISSQMSERTPVCGSLQTWSKREDPQVRIVGVVAGKKWYTEQLQECCTVSGKYMHPVVQLTRPLVSVPRCEGVG